MGHPVYAKGGPGPLIAFRHPSEEFFDAPFAVWLRNDGLNRG